MYRQENEQVSLLTFPLIKTETVREVMDVSGLCKTLTFLFSWMLSGS